MKRLLAILMIFVLTGCSIELPKPREEEVPDSTVSIGVEANTRDYIIIGRSGNEQGVYAIDLEKGQLQRRIYEGNYTALDISQNNLVIYRNKITGEEGSDQKFVVMDLKGKILKKIDATYPMVEGSKPIIRPDEKGIFYLGEIKNEKHLFYANFEDGSLVKIPNIEGNIEYISFKDNDNLIYSRFNRSIGRNEIYKFNLKNYSEEKLFVSKSDDLSPSLSPDGTKLAFLRLVNEKYVVYIKDLALDDQPYCLYKELPVEGGSLNWSKDMDYISFITKNSDVNRVKLYNFKKEMISEVGRAYSSIFSQDGYNIAYVQVGEGKEPGSGLILQELYVNPLRENTPMKIFEIGEKGVYSKSIKLLMWFSGEL